ncbi:MAG: class I SAM-dependent methyltransferase [Nostoc sp. ChiSLP02]|nr:class I SAM-dependent methyltransferase [Nostoc sp. DedSLP05]MDZ8099927.1 class I SAM-dependent methyltransferase [Nostoc sp. DedSLP01]MDZ8187678.1 class I SAM-dependent methyltransferase [Nostoc sp. ChiSLP02]
MSVNYLCGELTNQIYTKLGRNFLALMTAQGHGAYHRVMSDRKRSLFANLQGKVLEISPRNGSNFPYYPQNIHLIAIEPDLQMHSSLQKQAKKLGLNIDLRIGNAEWLDAEDNSIDTVVTTLVLSSVPNINYTLQAILRVLKPGGSLLFIEHIAAPQGSLLRKFQKKISPIWKNLADNCHPDIKIDIALKEAGFSNVNYDYFEVGLPIISSHIIGVATK